VGFELIVVKFHGILISLIDQNTGCMDNLYTQSFKKELNDNIYTLYFPFKKSFVFKDLLDELSIPRDYISCISLNGKGRIKDKGFYDVVISDGDTLEIFPLLAAG